MRKFVTTVILGFCVAVTWIMMNNMVKEVVQKEEAVDQETMNPCFLKCPDCHTSLNWNGFKFVRTNHMDGLNAGHHHPFDYGPGQHKRMCFGMECPNCGCDICAHSVDGLKCKMRNR